MDIKRLKIALREKYAWPGSYELAYITSDGAILCNDCTRKEWYQIVRSTTHKYTDGWQILAITHEAVSPEDTRELAGEEYISYCDHCNKEFGEFGS